MPDKPSKTSPSSEAIEHSTSAVSISKINNLFKPSSSTSTNKSSASSHFTTNSMGKNSTGKNSTGKNSTGRNSTGRNSMGKEVHIFAFYDFFFTFFDFWHFFFYFCSNNTENEFEYAIPGTLQFWEKGPKNIVDESKEKTPIIW